MRYFALSGFALFFTIPYHAFAFPQYGSLAGLSGVELAEIILTLQAPTEFPAPPGPPKDTSTKLVNDEDHPYIPPGPDDIRGPCPALNTLANHGYIPRNGVASPYQITAAVQEAFNMGKDLAIAQAYGIHILNGNLITNLMSIGGKTPLTGPDPPSTSPINGGLSDHGTFEGDASMSRADDYFGDNHTFNETVYQKFVHASSKSPDGRYDQQVAVDLRTQLVKDGIATNPDFNYAQTRYFQAASEAALAYTFFVDGRSTEYAERLDMTTARTFFEFGRMPVDFHRAKRPTGLKEHNVELMKILALCTEVSPGKNNGKDVNSYEVMPVADLGICPGYVEYANSLVYIYPNPTGALLKALQQNLEFLYLAFEPSGCTQVYPFGRY